MINDNKMMGIDVPPKRDVSDLLVGIMTALLAVNILVTLMGCN